MSRPELIHGFLQRLQGAAASVDRRIALMEVCGTHTMSAFRSGLHALLPTNLTLLSGPGCPVCVTAQGDIDMMLQAAVLPEVTYCTYGDMLRVPGQSGSLERARSDGADIRVIYSTLDAVRIAAKEPRRQVVLGAVGFETTAPATAAAVLQAEAMDLRNFSVLASHKQVLPAMLALLTAGEVHLDGFLCPGHVSVIIGSEVYRPIVEHFGLPCAITGFEDMHMLAGIARLVELIRDGRAELFNEYAEAVRPQGNEHALALLARVFETADARWRALGTIPQSGLRLRAAYRFFDAQHRLGLETPEDREVPGCLCGRVITGAVTPHACKLFGKACTPVHPIGPCMVSSEGTCQAYFKYARLGEALQRYRPEMATEATAFAAKGADI
jgi:hydrogenase expression/formation protein HypD